MISIDVDACIAHVSGASVYGSNCMICVLACPEGLIDRADEIGREFIDEAYAVFVGDDDRCLCCGLCAMDCPVDAISLVEG